MALELMLVGMGTVFVVLLIVIGMGKLLINMVNRFAPEEEVKPRAVGQMEQTIAPGVSKAISAAVASLTGGKGRVEKIERL